MNRDGEIKRFEIACTNCVQETNNETIRSIVGDRAFRLKIIDYINENGCSANKAVDDITALYIHGLLHVEAKEIRDGAIDLGLARNALRKALQ